MNKIRPYTPDINLDIYDEMSSHYDIMVDNDTPNIVPRIWHDQRVMFKDIVYYISLLYENNPNTLADIGSGGSIWGNWFDNIFTFEPNPGEWSNTPDSNERYNDAFVYKYNKKFDCAIAINSLHYVHFDEVHNMVNKAMTLVNDRFLFTFNLKILCKFSDMDYDHDYALNRLFNILKNINYNIVMLDYVRSDYVAPLNGHVRVIYETG